LEDTIHLSEVDELVPESETVGYICVDNLIR